MKEVAMNKAHIRTNVFILVFLLSLFLPKLSAQQEAMFLDTEPLISLDFKDASLKDILKVFSIQSKMNFIASEGVQDRKVTLYLYNVPIQDAMDKIFKANNLSYDLDKRANIFIVKDWGKPQVETITKVFYLKYATVSTSSLKEEMADNLPSTTTEEGTEESSSSSSSSSSEDTGKWKKEEEAGITTAIKKLLSKDGVVIEDFRTNSLIVTDIPSRMEVIAMAVTALDVPVPQVMLEVEMLDVSKNAVDKIGFKYGQTPFTLVLTGAAMGTMWPMTKTNLPLTALRQFTPGNIAINTGSNTYTAMLDFLKTQNDTKYLARPRILTLNNETAEIKITTQETVGVIQEVTTGSATTTASQPERMQTGVTLRVTPQINPDTGEITMFIMPTVKDVSTSTFLINNTGTTYYKDPETRSTKSVVRIKDGDTVVVGGLIRNERSQTITKLPFFGDLPILGSLFRHKNKEKDKERELLVFITPRLVKEGATQLAQAQKAAIPQREQGTATGVERQDLIRASLSEFEEKKK
jgi:type II secretory pathway component GspD/PulD (secretin)